MGETWIKAVRVKKELAFGGDRYLYYIRGVKHRAGFGERGP
jgi:hypothetical protein